MPLWHPNLPPLALSSVTPTDPALRPLSLGQSYSDPQADRWEFLQRERSVLLRSQSPTRIPAQPYSWWHHGNGSTTSNGNAYEPLTGIKLSIFHGQYTENVNAWITVIEDHFYLHETPENKKIANVAALFTDDALVWYLDLCSTYPQPPS